ncbi:hypothetical protein EX191_17125 [Vibrio chemaguriensis]|uniref:Zinc resistance-associated protein n=1 Tax=Vibrio chemaguriensis TaxID=2527672 RepID=A0ABX1I0U3_9VIBR|nr:hypothetical protein [Vibrio chemaguriensis]NKJ69472.1 hypothetical protein [Vibrio chemaguriensis]
MKTLITTIAVSAVLASTSIVASAHQENHGAQQGGMAMGMMSGDQMDVMHKHMHEMQSLMASIKQESDPEKLEQLLREHHNSMQEGMHMMMGGTSAQHAEMKIDERMNMMEQRMGMMNMMMEQMLESGEIHQQQSHGHK